MDIGKRIKHSLMIGVVYAVAQEVERYGAVHSPAVYIIVAQLGSQLFCQRAFTATRVPVYSYYYFMRRHDTNLHSPPHILRRLLRINAQFGRLAGIAVYFAIAAPYIVAMGGACYVLVFALQLHAPAVGTGLFTGA